MMLFIALVVALVWLVVFVHEAGHLIAARLVGAKVFRFQIGLGPHLRIRIGETEYCFGLVPAGGYILLPGGQETYETIGKIGESSFFDRNPDLRKYVTDERDWTGTRSLLSSAFIFAAGPLANLFMAAAMWWGASYFLPEGAGTYGKVADEASAVLREQVSSALTGKAPAERSKPPVSPMETLATVLFGVSLLSGISNLIPVTDSDGFGILICCVLGFAALFLGIRDPESRTRIRTGMGEWGWFFYAVLISYVFFTVLFGLWR